MLWFSAPEIYSSWDMQISVYILVASVPRPICRCAEALSVYPHSFLLVRRIEPTLLGATEARLSFTRTDTIQGMNSMLLAFKLISVRQLFAWKHHLRESSLVMCEIWQKLNFYNFAFIFIPAWLPTFDMAPVVCVDLTGFGSVRRDSCWVGFMSSYIWTAG